ncbi:MAG: glycosyltransferase family 8 protein [Candidatus Adiutrix sp.]|nr:glycosyltransferase family 8 protein [Candidatus Adiutrix sp.]
MSSPDCAARSIAPAFDGPAVAVVFATDANYAPYAAATIQSVIRQASPDKNYDLVLLQTALPDDDVRKLQSLAANRPNISLRFFDVSAVIADKIGRLFISAHLSPVTYYRLFAPAIFEKFAKILYLDVDLITLADVAALYETELGDNFLGAVRDFYAVKDLLARPNGSWTRQVGLRDGASYFNAGVALFNLSQMRAENFESRWFGYLQRVPKPRLHDQDILNNCCEGRVKFVDAGWNCQIWGEEINGPLSPGDLPECFLAEYEASKSAPKIIHYLSQQKPWQLPQLPSASLFWAAAADTPYYPKLLYNNLKQLNAETRKNKRAFPPLSLKLLFYRLMSLFGSPGWRMYYRDKGKKIQARQRHGW